VGGSSASDTGDVADGATDQPAGSGRSSFDGWGFAAPAFATLDADALVGAVLVGFDRSPADCNALVGAVLVGFDRSPADCNALVGAVLVGFDRSPADRDVLVGDVLVGFERSAADCDVLIGELLVGFERSMAAGWPVAAFARSGEPGGGGGVVGGFARSAIGC
jgi:hypothetical protein